MTIKAQDQPRPHMYGASVDVQDDHVVLKVGFDKVFLTPKEAKTFMYWLAQAYQRATGEIQ